MELMISIGILMLGGGAVYYVLTTSLHLQAKNTSLNMNSLEARKAYQFVALELRSAVSVPRLVNSTLSPVAGNGPAQGVSYQRVVGGPFLVHANALASSTTLRILTNGFDPAAGDWLVIPAFDMQHRIESDTAFSSTVRTLTLANALGQGITVSDPPAANAKVIVFITRPSAVATSGRELRYYPTGEVGNFNVIATNLAVNTPFSIPAGIANTRQILMNIRSGEAAGMAYLGLFRREGLNLNTRAGARFQLTEGQ